MSINELSYKHIYKLSLAINVKKHWKIVKTNYLIYAIHQNQQ